MSFDTLGLSPNTLQAVAESGYTTPTPIQQQAIPEVLAGHDVLGCAQTGTGKTAGFTLPMIDLLAKGRARARMPRSLILEPTRELAAQVVETFTKYGKYHRLTTALLIGGSSMADQERILNRGVDVLIATPGRLLDLFERGRILLADTRFLVIDEADRMLDMGFIPDVERIVSLLPQRRQTLFFSATMPKEVRRLADAFLTAPKEIMASPPSTTATTITQYALNCRNEAKSKRDTLRRLIDREAPASALVFCNRKRDVGIVFRSLKRHSYEAGELHGDMSQPARMETLERFKQGEIKVLVCSDVAARGLDIPAVSHVFNFDVPVHAEDYVHRIGRTGRAGRSGSAFTLVTSAEDRAFAAVQDLAKGRITNMDLDGAPMAETAAEESAAEEAAPARKERRRGARRSDDKRESKSVEKRDAPRKRSKSQDEEVVQAPVQQSGPSDTEPVERGAALDADMTGQRSFGDHVPAFMLRPASRPQSAQVPAEQPA